MDFFKYHGAGNDFVIVDNYNLHINNRPLMAAHICDRHFGVGADGFIAAEPSDAADVKMAFYNSDGTEAGMCGNGIRCFAKFVRDRKLVDRDRFSIETGDGIREIEILDSTLRATNVRVSMGKLGEMKKVRCKAKKKSGFSGADLADQQEFDLVFTHFGVPHVVNVHMAFGNGMKGLDDLALAYGESIEHAPAFALDGANVNFISVINKSHILCSTWERGAGKTLACGTGACSSAAVARRYHGLGDHIQVSMPGGDVLVTFREDDVWMEGKAVLTFVGSAPEF